MPVKDSTLSEIYIKNFLLLAFAMALPCLSFSFISFFYFVDFPCLLISSATDLRERKVDLGVFYLPIDA